MLHLVFHVGNNFGWGICAKHLTLELSRLCPVNLITWPFTLKGLDDDFDYLFLKSVSSERDAFLATHAEKLKDPVIQAITNHQLMPLEPKIKGRYNVGYTFFEVTSLPKECRDNVREHFDVVVAGSSWCENILRQHGIERTTTICQGVDHTVFNPCENEKGFFADKFVVFSGGKLELRKGQDLVIRAFKVLQDKHDDVLLINSWFNQWGFSMKTMAASPYINFNTDAQDYFTAIDKILLDNGVDPKKVLTLPPKPNISMARVYKNTDCGIFPNRCEGGTNLVLMEYMACGKPVIVSNSSGHRDVVDEHNAILLNRMKPMTVVQDGEPDMQWDDPDVDEIIDRLEWAYHNRDALKSLGEAAGKSMRRFTWKAAAKTFYDLTTTS